MATSYIKRTRNATLLWSNSSPTSEFTPQTISLDLSAFTLIAIQYKIGATSSSYVVQVHSINGYDQIANGFYVDVAEPSKRMCTPKTTGVQFYNGYAGTSQNNNRMIPFRIYGIS